MKAPDPLTQAAYYTEKLTTIDLERADAVTNRNRAIHKARADGATIPAIMKATGLTKTMLYKILGKKDA